MSIDLIVLGLIFDFFGVSILILVTFLGMPYQKTYTAKRKERYWWLGWKITFTLPPKLKKQTMQGFIPPKHMWNLIGFLFIGVGFLLQIIGNIN